MMSGLKVLMLEFNELTPRLMDEFISAGHLPNFERFREESVVAITDPEEPQEHLNPWVQWVTVHTGASYAEHGVFKLGEGADLALPTIADVVDNAGLATWICGSMNLPAGERSAGVVLPDPWHPHPVSQPPELAAFADLVRAMVQEHSNLEAGLDARKLSRFATFMLRHGLSVRTVRKAIGQLVDERRSGRGNWGRAMVLDRLQWDVFWSYHGRLDPRFATYFSNSTAHLQHVYWRNFEPDKFQLRPTAEEQRRYEDAVLTGYRAMDALVGEAIDRISDDTVLILCTALGQQPFVTADESGGKRGYRPRELESMVERLGLDGVMKVSPVMSEQFVIVFDDEASAEQAEQVLAGARLGGQALLSSQRNGRRVVTGCTFVNDVDLDADIHWTTGATSRFGDVFYRMEETKSGYHHPDGLLWMRIPGVEARVLDEKVPLQAVAPTVLGLIGCEAPPTMTVDPIFEMSQTVPGR